MAKEAKAVETTEVAPQKTVKAKTVEQKPSKPEWEIKDLSLIHISEPTRPY